ncbi:DUF6079 family protein [Nocardioides sp. WL0053]|uniref:DUF6079 family protein n=1 Tax=Nocardioides jiangsuensis TaxID=2866161 RepID=A0ABS7RPG7_9ACTN|nr:DUF6079 family protein [Nocardioides jiangsuensis]MBY9075953.1 DUF6079 family protein [Nocardioides jiangsuensis]
MTLLRDVISIPERVTASDFVVGLAEGVEHKKETLSTYVVTPQLAECFDKSLGLVSEAVQDQRSQAAFLHGSFGSGKSHFMAVLYMLLEHDPDARAVPELAEVVDRHDAVLQGKRVLPLTFHMIGAESLEQALFQGYIRQIRAAHPGCDLPALHQSDELMANADRQRELLGDDAFFKALNDKPATSGGFGGMGAVASGGAGIWDAESYADARSRSQGDPRRDRLVSDLVRTMFSAFASSNQYVNLDTGLAVISRHAHDLGYDAVVLFLDELILWLASHLGNREFVTNEGAKLAKLVESQDARRAIPLVSLIARQRDITEFLGTHVPGAERAAFADVFGWSRGRFDDIRLEDRNLPVIAEKRLLKPKDESARKVIDDAFAQVERRPEVWDVLLTGSQVEGGGTGSDQDAFRRTYPFSPALVATLVALSQALQRERTALKVMLQLLVDGRDDLEVNDLVPVGDLFDVLVDSQAQAVTDELKKQFETARRLYHVKLRRVLLDLHQLTDEQAQELPRNHAFHADDRLVKTLLLSALAPDVPALSGLTASRLAALNHGTIQAWLPGQEVAVVLQKMKNIAAQVGEVQVGEGDDPVITVELTEVDYEGVIERARGVDNEGNRRRALREMVWKQLGIREESTLDGVQAQSMTWRGRRVSVDLVFGNVRDHGDLPDAALMSEGERWKVVVDYPFDSEGQSPLSDLSRVETLQQSGVRSNTLVWIPAFLTRQRLEDLGTLVVLDHLLGGTGDRFHQHAQHLSPVDREQARALLRQRRDLLREKLDGVLKQAYGAAARVEADIDTGNSLESPFHTLAEGFRPQAPVGATLQDALRHLVDQALTFQWPAHPRFEPGDQEVRTTDLRKVLEHCEEAFDAPGGRHQVEQRDRPVLRRICNTLDVGKFHENHLQLDQSTFPWSRRLQQAAAREGLKDVYPVSSLLGYLDEPEPRGLDRGTSGLILRLFALMEDLAWFRDAVAVEPPAVDQVTTSYQLRKPDLPDEAVWKAAAKNGRDALGIKVTDLLNAANVVRLATGARELAQRNAGNVRDLERLLAQHAADLGVERTDADRWATASAVSALLDSLMTESDDKRLIEKLARAAWPTSAAAAKRSLETAEQVGRTLHNANWDVLRALRTVADNRKDEAVALLERLSDAAARDELSASLVSELPVIQREAIRLFTVTPPPLPPPPPPPPGGGGSLKVPAGEIEEALGRVRKTAEEHPGKNIKVTWQVEE